MGTGSGHPGLKDFVEDALTISAGSLFQSGTARMEKANWRRRVQHLRWWNLYMWPRSPLWVGCVKVDSMGQFQKTMGICLMLKNGRKLLCFVLCILLVFFPSVSEM